MRGMKHIIAAMLAVFIYFYIHRGLLDESVRQPRPQVHSQFHICTQGTSWLQVREVRLGGIVTLALTLVIGDQVGQSVSSGPWPQEERLEVVISESRAAVWYNMHTQVCQGCLDIMIHTRLAPFFFTFYFNNTWRVCKMLITIPC